MKRSRKTEAGRPSDSLVATITVGVDGRLYCQDLPAELFEIVMDLCPNDPELRGRRPAPSPEVSTSP